MKETEDCFLKVKKDYFKFLEKEKIFNKSKITKMNNLKKSYIPISFWIEKKYKEKGKTLFLGLSGGQGTGKTTTTGILKIILKKFFKRNVYVTSIDHFYNILYLYHKFFDGFQFVFIFNIFFYYSSFKF